MRTFASVVSILLPGGTEKPCLGPYTLLYSGSMFCWQSAVFRAPKGQSVFFMRNPQIVDEDKVYVLTVSSASALVCVVCIG